MKFSSFFCPTLKENPADSEVVSHQLMVRSGMIRQVAAGIYNVLPLGLRVFRKVENLVRDEMNHFGGIELLLPSVHPKELWEESQRWESAGRELLRIKDRKKREYCYAPTHEEVITDLVRNEIKSYKDLPKMFYQIQTKFRDEIRPRFGVMRSREFIMKDAYSFDIDDDGANLSYQNMYEAYQNIFTRCGLDFQAVAADSGNIGGKQSQEFMVLADSGEDEIVVCTNCGYSANLEKAIRHIPSHETKVAEEQLSLDKVSTPKTYTPKEVGKFLGVEERDVLKMMLFKTKEGNFLAVVIPGDREVNEISLSRQVGEDVFPVDKDEIRDQLELEPGFIGPIDSRVSRVLYDESVVAGGPYVVGANEENYHIKNVYLERDVDVEEKGFFHKVMAGDQCPNCQSELTTRRGIEVGHIFKLGTKYSEIMNAKFLDSNGKSKPMIMGCFGIGIARTVAAAIEQNHDEKGCIFSSTNCTF